MGVIATLFGLPIGFFLWMTSVPGSSFSGPLPALTTAQTQSAARLREDVAAIASAPRNVAHPASLEQAARHIEARLQASGYRVQRQVFEARG